MRKSLFVEKPNVSYVKKYDFKTIYPLNILIYQWFKTASKNNNC
jgi:hypothetical protein